MGDNEVSKEKEAVTGAEAKNEDAQKTAEKDDYAAVKEEKAVVAGGLGSGIQAASAEAVAVPEVENSENALMVLQETRDLMKRQVKLGKVRTVTGIIAAAFFAVAVVFGMVQLGRGMEYVGVGMQMASHVVDQLDVAMGMVGSIEDLVVKIGEELEAMDFDALNNTIENMSTITDDITKATNDIAGVTDALGKFTEGLKNFSLFGR